MIDKRLRQLDQIPEIDYWRDGLEEHRSETKVETTATRQAALFAKVRAKLDEYQYNPLPTLLPAGNLRVRIQPINRSPVS